ncbi:MAG: hypothetical protein LBU51_05530 [Bacteroidales bacterium]|jgi:hypothetical protein|nr:hypothetical protein [Bacteroidales bacterium]
MKKSVFFIIFILSIFLSQSAPKYFFQVYQVSPVDESINNYLAYEDAYCIILYNFWEEGGNVGFQFYNKTNKDIYIDLDDCFFVMNGISFDYYLDKTYTFSRSHLTDMSEIEKNAIGINAKTKTEVSIKEKKTICIPSRTLKIIKRYNISNSFYKDNILFKYPTSQQIMTNVFSKTESPFIFSNRISYKLENTTEIIKVENKFYVSSITNLPLVEMLTKYDITSQAMLENISSSNEFYVKYK